MGFKPEGKELRVGRSMFFSFGVPTHSFLCLGNPGARVPGRKAKQNAVHAGRVGKFSWDRSIKEYCDKIWKARPLPVELGKYTIG